MRPIIGITMGDAAGIGPEIILKLFKTKAYKKFCDIVIIGNKKLLDYTINHYGLKIYTKIVNNPLEVFKLSKNTLGVIEIEGKIKNFNIGHPSKNIGKLALQCIDKAIDMAVKKDIAAIVTAPVNKEVIALSYKNFKGHTDYIAEKLNTKKYNMLMASKRLKIMLVTTHIAIKEISKNISKAKIKQAIINSDTILKQLGYNKRNIAVLALNPHASDGGLFGDEEKKYIIPAINELKKIGINVSGPFVPDTFFVEYSKLPIYDIVVAMYHDQGLIPFKMLSFGNGINVTVGLPIIRTSVDHGTAYNIAGQNKAKEGSLFEAIKFAVMLTHNFAENKV